jgi:hypothetical protein
MNARAAKMMYWVVAVLLFLASGWSLNVATFFWFAADFPSDENRHVYASRGNTYFVLALALLAASVWAVVAIIRSSRNARMKKNRP